MGRDRETDEERGREIAKLKKSEGERQT